MWVHRLILASAIAEVGFSWPLGVSVISIFQFLSDNFRQESVPSHGASLLLLKNLTVPSAAVGLNSDALLPNSLRKVCLSINQRPASRAVLWTVPRVSCGWNYVLARTLAILCTFLESSLREWSWVLENVSRGMGNIFSLTSRSNNFANAGYLCWKIPLRCPNITVRLVL